MGEFNEYAEREAAKYLKIICNSYAYITHLEYNYGVITIHWEESARSCVIDGGTIDMPIDYLWDREWETKLLAKIKQDEDEKKAEAQKQADIDKREKAKAKREREIAQLAKLKLKYEE